MYINKTTLEGVSGFSPFSGYYWSSTEDDIYHAWLQYFPSGFQLSLSKFYPRSVRAVRAF